VAELEPPRAIEDCKTPSQSSNVAVAGISSQLLHPAYGCAASVPYQPGYWMAISDPPRVPTCFTRRNLTKQLNLQQQTAPDAQADAKSLESELIESSAYSPTAGSSDSSTRSTASSCILFSLGDKAALLPWMASDSERSTVRVCSAVDVGKNAGQWLIFGSSDANDDFPTDQRSDDAGSACFTSEPLTEAITLMGSPVVRLTVRSDQPMALLCVRLCAIAPDVSLADSVVPAGLSRLLCRGVLNLTHRDSHEHPAPFPLHTWLPVDIYLKSVAATVPAGWRLRLAVSTTYWPWVVPSPVQVSAASFKFHR